MADECPSPTSWSAPGGGAYVVRPGTNAGGHSPSSSPDIEPPYFCSDAESPDSSDVEHSYFSIGVEPSHASFWDSDIGTPTASEFEAQLLAAGAPTTPGYDFEDRVLAHLRTGTLRYLPTFWKMMVHIFHLSPYDLFTWGLRIELDEQDEIMSELSEILTHPLWEESGIHILRYVLQAAVCCRIRDHAPPLMPLSPAMVDILEARPPNLAGLNARRREEKLARSIFKAWGRTMPGISGTVRRLIMELERFPTFHVSVVDDYIFFVLRAVDIRNVRFCLNQMYGAGLFGFSVREYYSQYVEEYAAHWQNIPPFDADMLRHWEAIAISNRRINNLCRYPDARIDEAGIRSEIYYWAMPDQEQRFRVMMFNLTPLAIRTVFQ
ncbi:hypothetical protein AAE478_002033 [Parahypoxylon ruwenzoriense]